ncbi:hypothetical protein B7R54_02445 [Subtercola boreus]|uniref:Major facilitator superfamily (MFS) profile domain-containing protein n=1 Tax=Subtercola boreus TaxID=120213 RepID=A0A3E0VEX6_9MICO|nr:MFS transporter [Subtercola boreus]RFA08205.1 hypothetical protein B7R54_02445 [Subtercola boreus]TQL54900.1 putative MFS family arabinose efflux permease [Subtercola boreus]
MNAQAILVCAFIASAQMTWGVIVPALPLLVKRFDIGTGSIGLLIAAFAIGRVIANVPAGLALRRIPPRRFLQTVSVLLAVVTALTGLLPSEPLLLTARLVAGILGGAAVTIGFSVLVAGSPPERRGRIMSTATVVMMSGSAVGALLGGASVSVLGVAGAFAVAVLPLLLCVLVDLARPAAHYWAAFASKTDARSSDSKTDASSTAPQRALPPAGALVAGLVAVSFATFLARFAGEQGLIPVLAYESGGLTPLTLGVAMAAGTVISIAALPVVGRVVDRGARLSVLIPSALLGAVALLFFPVVDEPLAFGAVIVVYYVSTSVAGVVPNVVTGERFEPAAAGAVVGLTRTAGDIGAAVGPLAVFALADGVGAQAAVATIAAVLVAALAVLAPAVAGRRRPEPVAGTAVPSGPRPL